MKNDDAIPISTPTAHSSSSTSPVKKESSAELGLLGRGRYKFWALAAILLLAFWSMLTGTVTLRSSAGNLNRFSDELDTPIYGDFDVIEMEEREIMVKHMWDVYTNSKRLKLPKFWQQAFEAAYEDLIGDDPQVKEAAFSEIVKMSPLYVNLDPPRFHSSSSITRELSRKSAGVAEGNELNKD